MSRVNEIHIVEWVWLQAGLHRYSRVAMTDNRNGNDSDSLSADWKLDESASRSAAIYASASGGFVQFLFVIIQLITLFVVFITNSNMFQSKKCYIV